MKVSPTTSQVPSGDSAPSLRRRARQRLIRTSDLNESSSQNSVEGKYLADFEDQNNENREYFDSPLPKKISSSKSKVSAVNQEQNLNIQRQTRSSTAESSKQKTKKMSQNLKVDNQDIEDFSNGNNSGIEQSSGKSTLGKRNRDANERLNQFLLQLIDQGQDLTTELFNSTLGDQPDIFEGYDLTTVRRKLQLTKAKLIFKLNKQAEANFKRDQALFNELDKSISNEKIKQLNEQFVRSAVGDFIRPLLHQLDENKRQVVLQFHKLDPSNKSHDDKIVQLKDDCESIHGQAYLDVVIDNKEGRSSTELDDVNNLPPFKKLQILLSNESEEERILNNAASILDEFIKIVQQINPKVTVQYLNQYEFSKIFFGTMFVIPSFDFTKVVNMHVMAVLHSQGLSRDTLLVRIKSEIQLTGTHSFSGDQSDTPTCKQFVQMLKYCYSKLPTEIINEIVIRPDQLLHDTLIKLLASPDNQTLALANIVVRTHQDNVDPCPILIEILGLLNKRKWVLQYFDRKDGTQPSLQTILGAAKIMQDFENLNECRALAEVRDVQKFLDTYDINLRARGQVDPNAQQDQLEAMYKKMACDSGFGPIFDECVQIGKKMETVGKRFKVNFQQIYIAADMLAAKERIVFVHLPPGFGKSYVNAIVAVYYAMKAQKVIVTTVDPGLSRQMLRKLEWFESEHIKVLESIQIEDHFNKGNIFIYDEYDYDLMTQPFLLRSTGSTHPCYKAGILDKLFITTGQFSDAMNGFLKYRFGEFKLISCKFIEWLKQESERAVNCTVKCNSDPKVLLTIVQQCIDDKMKVQPVIVIGAEHLPKLFQQYKNVAGNFELINTAEQLDLASEAAHGKPRGLVFLAEKFKVGADIKFKHDAFVVVIAKEIPDRYSLIQMLGRGSRASGAYEGAEFLLQSPMLADSIAKQNQREVGLEFYDGAEYIETVLTLLDAGGSNAKGVVEAILKKNNGRWRLKRDEYLKYQTKANQNLLNNQIAIQKSKR